MSWIEKLLPPRIKQGGSRKSVPEGLWTKCPGCETVLYSAELQRTLQVCPKCSHHLRIGARERLDALLDGEGRYEIGQEIAYANAYSLKTMSSDGKNHKSLIVGGSSPHWSSDGKLLMYQLQKEANVGSKGFEIRVRNLETGQERLLVEHATLLDWHSFE